MTEITPVAIEDKMKDSYLSYSLSVIVSRALPDVRDGLKPVHRRILYASHELGLTHNKPHKKSARIVGEVLGKYHPHGDAAVYNAMVRMAQPFNQRYPLIDGHGNFGSIDGDSPAAMRYTEARLTEFSSQILKDIKMETVDFSDNFDDSLKEPDVLPSKIPNLLVNGASGIAVGMSTSIPPHNLKEVINVLKHLIKHPNARLDTIIQKMPGPDFPTGAKIVGTEGIKKAYKTGKGKITLRARAHLEKNGRKRQIIITELPYQVNKAKLIEEIADLVKKDKIDNITDIRDESDQEGMRIVVDLKRGADGEIVLNRLFKYSSLQTNFRINLLALNQNRPEVMDIKTMLKHFIEFRQEVITKRTRFKLKKAKARLHLVEGLIKAVDNLDRVITIIRRSESPSEAKEKLINNLKISDKQAKAILDMKLQRLVGMEIKKLRVEAEKLQEKIDKYNKILSDETELNEVLKDELNEIKEKFADKRKTEIIEDESKAVIDKEDLIKEKEALVSLSYRHNIKRTDDLNNIRAAKKDYIINILEGKSLDNLLFFTSSGNVYSLPIHNISEHHGLSTGESLNKYLNIPLKEKIIGTVCLNEKNKEKFITLATAKGMVKKTMGKEYQTTYNKIKAIKLNSGDEVIDTIITDSNDEIILGTKHGKAIRFKGNSINGTGRNTKGYKGINLYKNDRVKSMNKIEDKQFIAAITKSGKGNKSKIENFTLQKRNGRGLNIAAASNYNLQAVIPVNQRDKLLLSTNQESISVINISDMTTVDRPGY
ncbi:MAG: DNA gyrase subunit A, partial [Halanaerobiales bacterium]